MLTKKRKILIAVLGVGLAALMADRMIGYGTGGPSAAGAATIHQSVAVSSPKPGIQGDNTGSLVDDSLAAHLDNLRKTRELSVESTRDAFCPSQEWLSDLQQGGRNEDHLAATSSSDAKAQDFSKRHVLTAVVLSDAGGAAIIDDEYVPIGGTIEGFGLVAVRKNTAVLKLHGSRVVLTMDPDGSK